MTNLMKPLLLNVSLLCVLLVCVACQEEASQTNYSQYVEQSIGTGAHGHVFMGANVPFGMVQAGPTSIPETWDWCSGYHVSDSTVIGFAQTHLSGTGIGDLSDVTLMPVAGAVTPGRGTSDAPLSGQASFFSRKHERYAPGYYTTFLDRYDVQVELTATPRVAVHRYIYEHEKGMQGVVLDLENGSCWDEPTEVSVRRVGPRTVVGMRNSKGWAKKQYLAYAITFSKPIVGIHYWDKNSEHMDKDSLNGKVRYARFDFHIQAGDTLEAHVALSPTDTKHALMNMQAEVGDRSFEEVRESAAQAWEHALGKIAVKSSNPSVMTKFYTAMYHADVAPVVFNDVDGSYRGADGQVYQDSSFQNYTIFSLWDTYRAAHPLYTLMQPERVPDMVNSMLRIYAHQGRLPVWHLWGSETDCMKGTPSCIVIADAILKGLPNIDSEKALAAMVKTQMGDNDGLDLLKKYGFIPSDMYNQSIAEDMEYAIADGAVARIAELRGNKKQTEYFKKRSRSYEHYYDATTQFMRGRFADGSWRTPFDPLYANHHKNDYTEGNAYQYAWLVPHDFDHLVELLGGTEQTLKNLDHLFTVTQDLAEGSSPDMTGLIGQYVHGNEPSHHILYFYTMLGHPEKGAPLLRQVMDTLYLTTPEGLAGNEDVGQMSSWYVLSSLGFYQVDPAGGDFIFGTPMVDEATIQLPENKQFHIVAENNSKQHMYIAKIFLNGEPYHKMGISYQDIMQGGELKYVMSDTPSNWIKK